MRSIVTASLLAVLTLGCAAQTADPLTAEPQGETAPEVVAADSSPSPATASAPSTEAPATDVAEASVTPTVLRSGMFVDGEHPTAGEARLVQEGDGTFLVFGDDFQTDAGPDLVVVLHRSSDVIGDTEPPAFPLAEGDYVVLAPLQTVAGAQRYAIPAGLNLDDYASAAIWCQQFNATFGAATLDG